MLPAPVDISDPFRALSDPTRREIVDLLAAGPLPVRVVASHFPSISRPAVSKHLRSLREGGLVVEERKGRERFYSLQRETVAGTLRWMEDVVRRAQTLKATKTEVPGVSASAPGSVGATPKGRASSSPKKRRSEKPARSRQQTERTGSPEAAKPAEPAEGLPEVGTPEPGDWRAW